MLLRNSITPALIKTLDKMKVVLKPIIKKEITTMNLRRQVEVEVEINLEAEDKGEHLTHITLGRMIKIMIIIMSNMMTYPMVRYLLKYYVIYNYY